MTEIATVSPFEAIRRSDSHGDYWDGRELMPLLGYDKWERFEDAIDRARVSIANAGADPDLNASRRREPSGRTERVNYRFTRYGAYLVAMNGDVRKDEIAAAQTYFAAKTREAEVSASRPALPDIATPAGVLAMAEQFAATARQLVQVTQERDELAPAAESWNTLATAEGDFLVADAAKILSRDPNIKIGQNRLYTLLGQLGWIYRATGDQRWRTKQSAIELGRLSEIPMSHYHPRTGELVLDPPQIRVTVKGLGYLHNHLGGADQPALPAA